MATQNRRKGAVNKDSWQNDPDRKETGRKVNNVNKPGADPEEVARKRQEAYSDHPKNDQGENVCWAKKRNGTHCMLPAGKGTHHEGWGKCSFHGGNTPTLAKQGSYYAGVEAIERMTMSYGYGQPIDITPTEALLQEVQRAAGRVYWIEDRIAAWSLLDDEGHLVSTPDEHQQWWMETLKQERQLLAKHAKMALDAGVAERRVQLAEKQAEMMVGVLNTVFDQLGLTMDQRKQLPIIVPQAIRQMTSPGTALIEASPESTTTEGQM